MTANALIEFDNVSLTRGATRILDRIQLSIGLSQHVAIVGPNGSGKSSLLKMLMKIYYPSVEAYEVGEVRILGQCDWNVWELRRKLGFVSAEIDHHFMQGRSARLTALQAILTGYFSSELEPELETVTQEMQATALKWLSTFQLQALRDKPIGHMSTGERRRILLARALVFDPPALVLDEPTSGLDIAARAKLLSELEALSKGGKQLVLVTHHLEELLPCIQRIVLLKEGKVFFDGPPAEAISSERISKLYNQQIRIDRDGRGVPFATLL